ncbi:nuclear transport factor 2 family protein [Cryobacterium sp. HLT2-28]|uniref:nuclear transport factor 2 family protein n=1 Tax=Cryobacterium sp. HLT2-28 TaxID=1259146 RepID=UPI00106A9933|nr:nuclear transport factor 2 family protein [Cryobacterium sp. HLT2-28]TFB94534.1 nuclear transport factor 2 family protein [Cryobacterium sp. HLT2-28]
MSDLDVRELFLRAITDNDPEAMREGLQRLFGLTGEGLSPDAEFRLRDEDYVMEMPQSGERIRGREAMRAMQEAFPVPPSITLRRVVGSGQIWVVEGMNDYAGDVWHVVVILEFGADGSIIRDTRYYTQKSEAPGWRADWVEPID